MERIADVILISIKYRLDGIGQQTPGEEVRRSVIGTLHGISRQEWASVAQAGLNPQGMLFLRDEADYKKESFLEIEGEKYFIYRTYPTEDGGIELYYRKVTGVAR